MSDANQTPLQEAISIITIGAILVAVGCSRELRKTCQDWRQACFGSLARTLTCWPALNALHGAQIPILVGSATVGGAIFLFGIPLAPLLAARFAKAQLQNVERSTARLKKNRASLQKKERAKDDFIVH